MNKKLFASKFESLCERFKMTPSKDIFDSYWENLNILSDEEFISGCKWCFANCDFMPSPKKILRAIKGEPIYCMWEQFVNASHQVSSIRYDQHFRKKQAQILSELPPALVSFIKESKISLLILGDMPINQTDKVRKQLEKHLEHQTLNDVYLNLLPAREQQLLGGN